MVTDSNGCIADTNVFVDTPIAVDPGPRFKALKVYPLPVQDVLYIDLDENITEVIISGIDGRMVRRYTSLSGNQLDVSSIEAGWYILRISDGESWYISRLVK
jgi:hypothetical protein